MTAEASASPSSVTRTIAILVFIGLPALLVSLTAFNLLQAASDRQALAVTDLQIGAMTWRLQSRTAAQAPDLSAIYVSGTSRTSAIANLQESVVAAIAEATGRLIETAPAEAGAGETEAADRLQLRATLDIGNDGLRDLLYRLESGLPLMEIDSLSIRRLPAGPEDGSGLLRVDMTVGAHWKRQETQGQGAQGLGTQEPGTQG